MRRTRFPALVLIGLMATVVLTACGEEVDEPTASETTSAPTAAPSPTETSSEPTSEPTAQSTHVRSSKNITLRKPAEGATVSGTFTAAGKANSPEANVPWQVLDADGNEVASGFATAEGWMDQLYPWQTQVDVSSLEPGTYTFVAMTSDPSGGAEGDGAEKVSASIVVE